MSTDFTKAWDLSDVAFSVEGKPLYVNKMIMSMWSPVMKAMFYGDFRESNEKQIELPEKLFDDMHELVQVLHPPNKEIDEANVAIILPLAREYQMQEMTERCENFLLNRPPSVQGLVLAEEYTLEMLRESCMADIQKTRLHRLLEDEAFQQLSSETKVTILMDKALKYELVLGEVQDIVDGRKPEQMRFRSGGTLCTFTCASKIGQTKTDRMPHNSGTDRDCIWCALYMTRNIYDRVSVLP